MALLVELRSEHNRIAALTRDKRYRELNELVSDAISVRTALITDFNENFDWCPVYYFIDTNSDLVEKKQFTGILLDSTGKPMDNIQLNSTSTNYLVAYYGYPVKQAKTQEVVTDKYKTTSEEGALGVKVMDDPMGRGLIIMDDQFRQVNYFYKLGYDNLFVNHRIDKRYYFNSKRFDMEYYPFAGLFNKIKLDRYGNHRIPIFKNRPVVEQ